ncbi:hypothetical protein A5760_16520 [Mycobacterium colombiense]|uniref:Methyltransferase domain-containing protein n=1 Tax=Mycobacterium colombiense TaxID=339268 RepID=A0A1A0VDZ3_9MYCO|nr:hypothetical protein A5760_16520 [Mycobacterium colombiense]
MVLTGPREFIEPTDHYPGVEEDAGVDQPDFLTSTRDSYDRTAFAYSERFHHHLDSKPVDLAVVNAFAGLILKGQDRRVIDIGCGTGATTALLNTSGVEVSGVDLSPNMVAQARRLNPGLEFDVGSMTNLDIPDCSVGGVCAWYSIIHIPDTHLTGVFAEFNRVLTPGGLVLLAFQIGDEPRILSHAFGHDVHLTRRFLDYALLFGDEHLGERPGRLERRPAQHFIADAEPGDALPDCLDDASKVVAHPPRELAAGHDFHVAVADLPVHRIGCRCPHTDQHLAGAEPRRLEVLKAHNLGPAVLVILDPLHRCHCWASEGRADVIG